MVSRQVMACRAHELRRNMTPHERKLWFEFLCDYNPSFRCQKVIGNYIVDFYCRRVRLSIEIDGGQHYESRQIAYDSTRTMFLELREIEQLRFSNREIDEEFEGVCETIHQKVLSRRHDLVRVPLSRVKSKS